MIKYFQGKGFISGICFDYHHKKKKSPNFDVRILRYVIITDNEIYIVLLPMTRITKIIGFYRLQVQLSQRK